MSGGILGAYAVGAIRSTADVLAPVRVFLLALANIAPVKAARLYHEHGAPPLLRYLGKLSIAGFAMTAAMVILGSLFASQIVGLLYGDEYRPFAYLIHWWAVIYLVGFLEFPLETGLKAIEHTRPLFYTVVIEAIFAAATSYLLASLFGLPGAGDVRPSGRQDHPRQRSVDELPPPGAAVAAPCGRQDVTVMGRSVSGHLRKSLPALRRSVWR